jgi:hypothetical protein
MVSLIFNPHSQKFEIGDWDFVKGCDDPLKDLEKFNLKSTMKQKS